LALHLPGGRQLFVTTGGALWTQQRSSGVCYKRKEKIRFDTILDRANSQALLYLMALSYDSALTSLYL